MTESTAADWERARDALGPDQGVAVPGYLARAFAFVIDVALIAGLVLMVEFLIGLVLLVLATMDLVPASDNGGWWIQPAREAYASPVLVAVRVVSDLLVLAYMPWFWAKDGQTPAMAFLGMRVVPTDTNGAIGYRVAIRRMIALLVSILSVVGILWIFVDPKRRGWHDIFAGTTVIAE